ncbi:MAG TPA: glycosyltransferase family 4 protein [Bryobacteraceae bacterium]|nr:glycosyltransferase family 4 protein [Bryobacteraceae bacterium]
MRILHLDSGREMRGGQRQVLFLMEGLAAAGVESTLLAREQAPLFAAARQRGWRVEPLGWTRAAMLSGRHNLVHAHDARTHTMGAILRGGRLVVARRVAFPPGSRWKYGRARRYLAVSDFVKSVLMAGGVPEEKIAVVHDGVPVLECEPGNTMLAPANASDPQKGAPLAMEAARLAGTDLHLSADLERDLRRGAIFVYVTHSEGLGSGVLLAMSAGAAVVASNVGGLREVVRNGENGLLVENDPAAIAAAIRELRGDPGLRGRLGEAARRTVIERFTVDRMVRRTMEVYRQVLE